MGFAFGFDMFGIMFTLVFVLVIGTFIVTAVRGISQWNKNTPPANNTTKINTGNANIISKLAMNFVSPHVRRKVKPMVLNNKLKKIKQISNSNIYDPFLFYKPMHSRIGILFRCLI